MRAGLVVQDTVFHSRWPLFDHRALYALLGHFPLAVHWNGVRDDNRFLHVGLDVFWHDPSEKVTQSPRVKALAFPRRRIDSRFFDDDAIDTNALQTRRDSVENGVAYLFTIFVAMKVLYVLSIFYTIVSVCLQKIGNRKRAIHADAGQNEIAASVGTEVEVAGLVQKNVDAIVHRSVYRFDTLVFSERAAKRLAVTRTRPYVSRRARRAVMARRAPWRKATDHDSATFRSGPAAPAQGRWSRSKGVRVSPAAAAR